MKFQLHVNRRNHRGESRIHTVTISGVKRESEAARKYHEQFPVTDAFGYRFDSFTMIARIR